MESARLQPMSPGTQVRQCTHRHMARGTWRAATTAPPCPGMRRRRGAKAGGQQRRARLRPFRMLPTSGGPRGSGAPHARAHQVTEALCGPLQHLVHAPHAAQPLPRGHALAQRRDLQHAAERGAALAREMVRHPLPACGPPSGWAARRAAGRPGAAPARAHVPLWANDRGAPQSWRAWGCMLVGTLTERQPGTPAASPAAGRAALTRQCAGAAPTLASEAARTTAPAQERRARQGERGRARRAPPFHACSVRSSSGVMRSTSRACSRRSTW